MVHENGGQNESIGNGLICKILRMIIIYELATIEEMQAVYDLVQHMIKKVYPKYYPAEVVGFFCELHSKETIKRDIENGLWNIYNKEYRNSDYGKI